MSYKIELFGDASPKGILRYTQDDTFAVLRLGGFLHSFHSVGMTRSSTCHSAFTKCGVPWHGTEESHDKKRNCISLLDSSYYI